MTGSASGDRSHSPRSCPSVIVVGGGIAGLAATYRLRQCLSEEQPCITLLEAGNRLGGKIQTEQTGELVFEAGPDSFLSYKPAALRLCNELGILDRVIGTSEAGDGTSILRDNRLEPLPEGITMLVPTRFGPLLRSRLLSFPGKLRMLLEPLVPPRRDETDESVGSFVRRRLGDEAFERMAQPLLSGIYAGDADQMSIQSTFPRLRETERRHGSLFRGMLAQRQQVRSQTAGQPAWTPFVSLRGGLGELVETLAGALTGVELRLGTAARSIVSRPEGGYELVLSDGTRLAADAIVLATPAYASAELVTPLDPELAGLLAEIPYVSTATISLAYRRADLGGVPAGRGLVIPRLERRELTAVTWVSNKFAGRAPDDLALIRGFVGRAGQEEAVSLPDDRLIELTRIELREIIGLRADPVDARIYRWPRGLPQYVLGHPERLAAIDRRLVNQPGLFLTGSAYRGVGIPDCIESGERAAAQVAALLSAPVEPVVISDTRSH